MVLELGSLAKQMDSKVESYSTSRTTRCFIKGHSVVTIDPIGLENQIHYRLGRSFLGWLKFQDCTKPTTPKIDRTRLGILIATFKLWNRICLPESLGSEASLPQT